MVSILQFIRGKTDFDDDANHANCFVRKPDQWDTFASVVRHMNTFWLLMAELPPS